MSEKPFTNSILSKDAKAVLGVLHAGGLPGVSECKDGKWQHNYFMDFLHPTNTKTGEYQENIVNYAFNDTQLTIENLDKGMPELLGKVGLTPEDHFKKVIIRPIMSGIGNSAATTQYTISKESVEAIKAQFPEHSLAIVR